MTSSNAICVVPAQIQNANDSEVFQQLYKPELDYACELISGIVVTSKELEQSKKNNGTNNNGTDLNYYHQHNTLTVVGRRGVGKTTFILSFIRCIQSKKQNHGDGEKSCEFARDVVCLPPLDPSRMEDTETFLVTIVANILRELEKRQPSRDLPEAIRNALSELGREFVILAPKSVHQEQWKDLMADPDGFAFDILYKAHSGLNLALRFHNFVGACLKDLGAHVFLQPIDDVDTAFVRGWPVLETIRRYLATPNVIPILSGDIDLYELVVRRHQMDAIRGLIESKTSLKEDTRHVSAVVNRLTSQYLAKVVPCYLRIRLRPVVDRIRDTALRESGDYIKVDYTGEECVEARGSDGKGTSFSKLFGCFCADFFGIPFSAKVQASEVFGCMLLTRPISLILPNVTRNFVRFLNLLEAWEPCITDASPDEEEKNKGYESLLQIYQASLDTTEVWPNDLRQLWKSDHVDWLATYCLDHEHQAPTIWRLDARYDDEEWNQTALLLQGFLYLRWKQRRKMSETGETVLVNAEGPLAYIMKVLLPCWTAESYSIFGNDTRLRELKRWLHVPNTERHLYMPVRNQAYLLRFQKGSQSTIGNAKPFRCLGYMGVIDKVDDDKHRGLRSGKKNDKRSHGNTIKSECEGTVPYLGYKQFAREASPCEKFILNWFSHPFYRSDFGHLFSVNILFALARLTDVLKEWPCDTDQSTKGGGFKANLLKLLGQMRIWHIRNAMDNTSIDRAGILDGGVLPEVGDAHTCLVNKLDAWVARMRDLQDEDLLPPPVIAQVWVRFTGNLESLADLPIWNVGMMLERSIASFFNALLIEEVIHRKGISGMPEGLKIEYIGGDTSVLRSNIGSVEEECSTSDSSINESWIPYTMAWMDCPLLVAPLSIELQKKIDEVFMFGATKDNRKKDERCPCLDDARIHNKLCSLVASDYGEILNELESNEKQQ